MPLTVVIGGTEIDSSVDQPSYNPEMLFLFVAATLFQTPAQTDMPAIPKFLQVDPQFCTGAQPRLEAFTKLKADGVKAVLNLRQPSEHRAADEQAAVEAAGMKYFNIPVEYRNPTDADADQFLKITDDPANRPMFIHCTAAIRVGAFWAIRRAVRDGLPVDVALEEGRKVGLTNAPHLEEYVRKYVASHPAKK